MPKIIISGKSDIISFLQILLMSGFRDTAEFCYQILYSVCCNACLDWILQTHSDPHSHVFGDKKSVLTAF